ncbi:MAG: GGDEF domain-containing protein [Longicatena sp.]
MKIRVNNIKKRRFSVNLAGFFLVLCILISGLCYQHYNELKKTIEQESKGYLQEITTRIGSDVNTMIKDNYALLDTIYALINNTKASTFENIQEVIEMQQKHWQFDTMMLIDEDGVAYNSEGKTITLSSGVYLRDTMLHNKNTMSPSQLINNKEYVVFAIPVKDMHIANKNMVAIAVNYKPEIFENVLKMKAFGGEAYSQIIDKNGLMVIRSSAKQGESIGYNAFTTIHSSKDLSEDNFQTMLSDIKNNASGQFALTLNGEKVYMVYTPIKASDWFLYTFVPTKTVNEKSDAFLNLTILFGGFITLMFLFVAIYIWFVFYRNRRNLEEIAYVDIVTNGHTIQKFYELMQVSIAQNKQTFALVYINVDKFKMVNEEFGREQGDEVIRCIQKGIEKGLYKDEYVGHISADNFCVLVKFENKEKIVKRFSEWCENIANEQMKSMFDWKVLILEFGVFIIQDKAIEFPFMVDRAKLALREVMEELPDNNKVHYAFYDENARKRLVREKHLTDRMEEALNNNEFMVYLQPKYNVDGRHIEGAEALVRWNSYDEGMIYPNEFIPLFEKNGFIINLDLWMFEHVCQLLERWQSEGKTLVKVSINCSRAHLKNRDFVEQYKAIFEKYTIPAKYIEIEMTESIVYENKEELKYIISQFHALGFECSMDDFGSGYSSLNLIQDLPFDTLKIDRIFFTHMEEVEKTEAIIQSIIMMAKALSMHTVAEGVEELQHVEMLRRIDCELIQGYVFAKPQSIEDFEKLFFK